MLAQIVRFASRMTDEQVMKTYEARAPRYRALPGLVDKYYVKFDETGEHGAVYLWASPEALAAFRESELARTIPEAYQVIGAPNVLTATVVMQLRSPGGRSAAA